MSVISDCLTAIKAAVETAVTGIPVKIRKNLRRVAADDYPLIVVTYSTVSKETLCSEAPNRHFVTYNIDLLYLVQTEQVDLDSTAENNLQTLRNLFDGFADLTVPGVKIDDIDLDSTVEINSALARKGIEHRIVRYILTTIES